jgi:hypothetical protein
MPNRYFGALSPAFVVLACLAATPATAPASAAGEACKSGNVRASINAMSVCLGTGARCTTRYRSQYAKYGFSCISSRLAKTKKTTPPTTSSTTTNTSPAGPFAGTWYAIDPTDGSLERVTFGSDGSMMFRDESATTCGGVWAYATATGAAKGNVGTAAEPATLLCPDNEGSVSNHLFQFTLNANGTLTATDTPDVWTRQSPR